jgi:PBSX family phage terminase large subunit
MLTRRPRQRAKLFTPIIHPNSKSEESLYRSTRRLNIWEGSVRSGKTISSILRWVKWVVTEAPDEGELLMTGKTYKTMERNVLNPIIDMLGSRNAWYNRGTGEFFIQGCNRPINIIGANDERSQEKIRGATICGAYGDELTLWPESFFKMLLSRLSVKGAKFFGTTNPDSPYHWLKKEYINRQHELDMAVFHFILEDNPFLDPDYVSSLKKEYTGLWYKRFIDGLWVLAEGAVYDMWDDDLHTLDVRAMLEADVKGGRRGQPRFRRYFVAIDYGTNNPCTFGLYGFDKGVVTMGGKAIIPKVYLEREYYWDSNVTSRQKTDAQYGDDFVKWLGGIRPEAIYVDPSALSFISELRHRGYRVTEAKNDVLDGIRFVGKLLSAGKFLIDKSCEHTTGEFSAYVWDTKAQARGEDKPIKEHDHAMDRNRYGLYTHFFRENPTLIHGFNFR